MPRNIEAVNPHSRRACSTGVPIVTILNSRIGVVEGRVHGSGSGSGAYSALGV